MATHFLQSFRALQTRSRFQRRGVAIYMTVMSVAMLVSLLGLASLLSVRVERNHQKQLCDRVAALNFARSAVELGILRLGDDASWRTNYSSGTYTAEERLQTSFDGSLSFAVSDVDGSLIDDDTLLRLSGIGRVGDTVQVLSLEVAPGGGPETELRSYTDESDRKDGKLEDNKWWGQYFTPNLPPTATAWSVTRVEIYAERDKGNRDGTVKLYHADASGFPENAAVDSTDFNSTDVGKPWEYKNLDFSGEYWFAVTDDACLTFETNDKDVLNIRYANSGVVETGSGLLRGSESGGGTWDTIETDKALLYRIYGVYSESSNPLEPVAGTWSRDAAP